jgi:hypothetical protein
LTRRDHPIGWRRILTVLIRLLPFADYPRTRLYQKLVGLWMEDTLRRRICELFLGLLFTTEDPSPDAYGFPMR